MTRHDVDYSQPVVGGFPTIACTGEELAQLMLDDVMRARALGPSARPQLVFSSNGQGIALAGRSESFRRSMAQADIVHADGMPVVFASKLTRTPLPERIATTDFFHEAARVAEEHGLRFFMLGATAVQNALAIAAARQRYPALQIVGSHHGYFDEGDDESICAIIRDSGADVVWVALGKPRQEEWSQRNRERLAGVAWVKTCGGLYAFLAGDVSRAPAWMQRVGLEWLYRMFEDPRRLAVRYLWTNPYAAYRLLRYTRTAPAVRSSHDDGTIASGRSAQ